MKYFFLILAIVMTFNTFGYIVRWFGNYSDGATAMVIIGIVLSMISWTIVALDNQ